ncbi:MAG: hypothetical protein ACJ72W_05435 [Actinoallomurus sp.]
MLNRLTKTLSALLAPVPPPAALAPPEPASAVRLAGAWPVWPGVVFRTLATSGPRGPILGDLLEVDLREPRVTFGLLRPPAVAAREPVSVMADAQHAVAGVNGDFFNIAERSHHVPPTGAAVGPEVADGRGLKAAVPFGQRFGPRPPADTTTENVLGVDADRTARITTLRFTGTADAPGLRIPLTGFNQYALPVGGVGAFTALWGAAARMRAVCGTDTVRKAPCSADTAEVTVRRGVVTRVGAAVGAGAIPADTTVLVGREAGAGELRRLRPGDRVRVAYRLSGPVRLRFAVGGFPILRGGVVPPDLDATVLAARTAAGVSRDGRRPGGGRRGGARRRGDPGGRRRAGWNRMRGVSYSLELLVDDLFRSGSSPGTWNSSARQVPPTTRCWKRAIPSAMSTSWPGWCTAPSSCQSHRITIPAGACPAFPACPFGAPVSA